MSAGIKKYPTELRGNSVFIKVWKGIKFVVKQMSGIDEAKEIRNNIDAHKCHSFAVQLNAYKKCSWGQSTFNMNALIKIIDVIQQYMDIINSKMSILYEQYQTDIKERIKQYERVMEELQNLQQLDMNN